MNLQTIEHTSDLDEEKAFAKYFNDSDLFQLFQYDDNDDNCETLNLILSKDGFKYKSTPTNDAHIKEL